MHKLPAVQTIKHALKAVFQFRNAGVRIGLPWVLVLAGMSVIDRSFSVASDPANGPANMILPGPMELVIAALSLVIFSSIAVNWHRYILLDEVPQGSELFRLDDKTWRYFGNVLLISLIMVVTSMLIVFPLVFISSFLNAPVVLAFIIMAAVLCLAGILFLRLSVKLPSIALGRRDFPLSRHGRVAAPSRQHRPRHRPVGRCRPEN